MCTQSWPNICVLATTVSDELFYYNNAVLQGRTWIPDLRIESRLRTGDGIVLLYIVYV